MNIFALSDDPEQAAKWHSDRHVNKMLLESVQILNTALYERGLGEHAFYGATHENHPCVLWAAESWKNFDWLVRLTHYLNKEYKFRYDHDEHHASYRKMVENWRAEGSWVLPAEPEPRTSFALAVPDDVVCDGPVVTYRRYYQEYKADEDWFEYSHGRSEPKWLSE